MNERRLPDKLYFRIGEVADLVGVERHVLRYWEREFRTSVRPTKSAKGHRIYSRRDVENLLRVRDLLYTHGFTIAGARKRMQRPGAAKVEEQQASADAAGDGAPTPASTAREGHTRETLLAVRSEIEAFLDELGSGG